MVIRLVLASASPNRLLLLRQIGVEPRVVVSNFEENLSKDLPVREFVEETSRGKALEVLQRLQKDQESFDVILACDTVIHLDNEIIGKPNDAEDAVATLKRLRGRSHGVYTGVTLAFPDGSLDVFSEETQVRFGDFSDETIHKYVATGEPLNKAGAYGIQNRGAVFVEGVVGCFSNVVGIPLFRVHSQLQARNLL